MITDTPIGRAGLTSQLEHQLGTLVSSVEIAIRNNLSSSNVVAETTLAGLLNLVYGWDLVNANAISQNFPGVDLIDQGRNIAVQVTSTRSVDKVRHTLTEVAKLGVTFDRLIILIITNQSPTREMKACSVNGYSGSMEIWNIPEVFRVARELDAGKLEKITEYMAKELGPVVAKASLLPHLELPLVSALQATGFVGRKDELATIRKKFDDGDKLVVLTGLGGMGKTELAVKFGRDYAGAVYFARFDTSFTKTLANMAQGIRPALSNEELRQPEDTLCAMVQELLGKADKNDLLIIDNADSDTGSLADLQKDAGYNALMRLPLKILLTTRSETPRAVKIKAMGEEPLFEIFENHGADVDNNEKRSLIEAVKGHTLTIDLIARTLADNWVPVSTKDMLDAIANSTLSVEDFPEVGADYNQDPEQMHIYQRLRIVFQVAKIPDVEKSILRCATLLPESGLDVRYFRTALTDEMRKAFPTLGKRGWLTVENGLLTIHPVIRLVCRTELEPTDENCGDFLDAIWGQYNEKEYDLVKYTQLAEVFAIATEHLENLDAEWLNRSIHLFYGLAQYESGRILCEKHLHSLEDRLPDSVHLATLYTNLGSIYNGLGKHNVALEYKLKALQIYENLLPQNYPILATSYSNIGLTYSQLGNSKMALKYMLSALEVAEKILPPDYSCLAIFLDNIGLIYSNLGNYSKALECKLNALEIQKNILPPDHPKLAVSYNNVGTGYSDLGDHARALEYKLKSLSILEKVLPPDHPYLAASYNNVGGSYGDLGEHQKGLEYKLKALELREKILPSNHPDLAASYNDIGYAYRELGNNSTSLEYFLKALDIRKRILPPEHPDLALSYNNLGYVYMHMGCFSEALICVECSLEIYRRSLPEAHPDIVNTTQGIALLNMLITLTEKGRKPQDLLKLLE